MKINTLILAFFATAMTATSAQAGLVTIDFTTANQPLTSSIYSEDGFEVNGTGTNDGRITGGRLTEFIFLPFDVFTISRDNGELFQFISFVHGSSGGPNTLADEFEIFGYLNGVQVVDFGTFAGGGLSTVSNLSSILIDQLQITGTGFSNTGNPVWDNFVFDTVDASEVPLPAAAWVFLAGLGGLSAARRKRRATK